MFRYLDKFVRNKNYYNETLNDRWIIEYVFPGKRDGYFLEAGAANGKDASSCYLLEQELGWQGICIEPNDNFFPQLINNRPRSICEQVCPSNRDETVVYIQGSDDTVSPYLSGIKNNLEQYKYRGKETVQQGKAINKPAVTLESIPHGVTSQLKSWRVLEGRC